MDDLLNKQWAIIEKNINIFPKIFHLSTRLLWSERNDVYQSHYFPSNNTQTRILAKLFRLLFKPNNWKNVDHYSLTSANSFHFFLSFFFPFPFLFHNDDDGNIFSRMKFTCFFQTLFSLWSKKEITLTLKKVILINYFRYSNKIWFLRFLNYILWIFTSPCGENGNVEKLTNIKTDRKRKSAVMLRLLKPANWQIGSLLDLLTPTCKSEISFRFVLSTVWEWKYNKTFSK